MGLAVMPRGRRKHSPIGACLADKAGFAIAGWIAAFVLPAVTVQLNISAVMVNPPVPAVKPM